MTDKHDKRAREIREWYQGNVRLRDGDLESEIAAALRNTERDALDARAERIKELESRLDTERQLFESTIRLKDQIAKHRDAARAENERLREALSRLEYWSHRMGAELCPRGVDTYGEGVRDCKSYVGGAARAALAPATGDKEGT